MRRGLSGGIHPGWRILRAGNDHNEGAKIVDRVRRRFPALTPAAVALVFNGLELGAILLAILIAQQVTQEGESTWFEGMQLLAVYAVLGLVFVIGGLTGATIDGIPELIALAAIFGAAQQVLTGFMDKTAKEALAKKGTTGAEK